MDSSESNSDSKYSVEDEGTESSSDEANSSDDDVPKLADDEYKEMPFEDLLLLQKKLGSRVYNEAIFGKTKERKQNPTLKPKPAKRSKHTSDAESDDDSGPEEVSAKRKVPALGMGKVGKNTSVSRPRDPRFDPRQGYFSGRQFRNNYSFINDLRSSELMKLKKKLEGATDQEETEGLKFLIQRTENQIREYAKQKALDKNKLHEKQQARLAVQEGKRPFYERKSTKQARALVEQYDKLKDDGSLAKHIDKRRKKVSAKDRKKLDFST
ncbi:ribosomal RNA processing protein 36 homolog [Anopheles marshallii]|uniref:ribosomal RNA processing protein 36 homolog n=1 Tax=Anopheles marshallii TaxID=1521116 RepID=UPI00237B612E|nr:ribosomal RNA processing protein 36 homolog [Anopheles marshallii]